MIRASLGESDVSNQDPTWNLERDGWIVDKKQLRSVQPNQSRVGSSGLKKKNLLGSSHLLASSRSGRRCPPIALTCRRLPRFQHHSSWTATAWSPGTLPAPGIRNSAAASSLTRCGTPALEALVWPWKRSWPC